MRATFFIQVVGFLDQAQPDRLNEKLLRPLSIRGDGRNVVESAQGEIVRNLRHRLRPSFGCGDELIASADQIFLWLRAESRSENSLVVVESGFGRRDFDDRAVRVAQIDSVKVVTVVRTGNMHSQISQTALPFQKSVSRWNVERQMMVRPRSPTA